jgi:hypothetical protein
MSGYQSSTHGTYTSTNRHVALAFPATKSHESSFCSKRESLFLFSYSSLYKVPKLPVSISHLFFFAFKFESTR